MPLKYKKENHCLLLLLLITGINNVYSRDYGFPKILALQTPVIHLSFDDGVGSDMVLDTSINMNDGVLTNMDPATDWVAGVDGLAIDTDGVNDYVSVADDVSLDFGSDDFTVSYWFNKNTDTSAFGYAVSKWNNGSSSGTNEWLISTTTAYNPQNNKVSIVVEIGNTQYSANDSNTFSLNVWHHVVGLRKGSSLLLYLDGKLVASSDVLPANGSINNVGRELRIGNNQLQVPSFPFDGQFDDLQIYRFAANDGNVAIGEVALGQISYLFNNPGMELPFEEAIFENGFEN